MNQLHPLTLASTMLAAAALVAACGGGDDSSSTGMSTSNGTGTLSLSLTDAPSCGYDSAFVTVEKVRVHQSSSAGDGDAGWSEVVLNPPQRVDLLTLTNGTLMPLGQSELPAGTYTQMRLVLGSAAPPGWPSDTLANAIRPTGGDKEIELTTPSGQQSGLKMNVNIAVPAGQVADFAIDFDACKSFVKAGNSGKYLLKPVLSVIPILQDPGQRIVGFVDLSLANTGTTVSAQVAGLPVRATPPNSTTGRFVLYPVPAGTYDLVITATGHVNAVMTGVPVVDAAPTLIGSDAARIDTPPSLNNYIASGTISVNGSIANTGGAVRATQTLSGGPTIEVGYGAADALTGLYGLTLPAGAPVKLPYVAGATTFAFAGNPLDAGKYRLEASAPGFAVKAADISLTTAVVTPFAFAFP